MHLFIHALRFFARKYSWEEKWLYTILFAVICALFTAISHIAMERRIERRENLLPMMGAGQFAADPAMAKMNLD